MRTRLLSVGTVTAVLVGWYVVTELKVFPPMLLPSPATVWNRSLRILNEGYRGSTLAEHVYISLYRLSMGFLLACVTGVPLGLAMGYSRTIQALFDPVVEFYRQLPPLAYLTILVLWFGIGENSKVILLYLSGVPALIIGSAGAVKSVRIERINGARSLGATRWQVFRYVVLPSCLPQILNSMRVASGVIYSTLIAAEMIASVAGLGWMILDASRFLRSDVIFMGVFLVGVAGVLVDQAIRQLEIRLVPWAGRG
jgi:taurine transport system permease protein